MNTGKSLNRRNFLRSGIIGTAGAMIAGHASASPEAGNQKKSSIVYRELGKTGIKLPVVSMGVMRADNPNLVKAALSKGIKHLDTAHGYQGGKNEAMLGELLQNYDRDSFVISTKLKARGLDKDEFDSERFLEDMKLSLERLKMDYVDILYVHAESKRESILNKKLIDTLQEIKNQGKTRFVGVSTHSNMSEVIDAAADSNFYDIVLTSYNFQLKNSEDLAAALKKANNAGLGIIAMKTMAGGFFDKERKKPVNTKAALKWALQNECIHTAIPGYTSFDQLEESFSVMEDLELSNQEIKDLNPDDTSASLYCSGCRECVPLCPKGLHIPELMRAYMYTYGYHNYEKAQQVLASELAREDDPCKDCRECTVICSKGFNVTERIRDVSRLKNVPSEFFA